MEVATGAFRSNDATTDYYIDQQFIYGSENAVSSADTENAIAGLHTHTATKCPTFTDLGEILRADSSRRRAEFIINEETIYLILPTRELEVRAPQTYDYDPRRLRPLTMANEEGSKAEARSYVAHAKEYQMLSDEQKEREVELLQEQYKLNSLLEFCSGFGLAVYTLDLKVAPEEQEFVRQNLPVSNS